ncbi:MAG: ribonuclease J [Chloroflexi bacterium]|nr:ribonuclease J [Chloroflexota bacterium]
MVKQAIKVISLGGVGEVGKNSTVVQYGKDMVLVDAGVMFPEEQMLGVDLVIPDFSYVRQNVDRLRAVLLTHGHEDHIGAVPYLLQTLGRRIPIYGSTLTLGLLKAKLEEFRVTKLADLQTVESGRAYRFGTLEAEFVPVSHSVPDARAIVVDSPAGAIVMTGDFKLDETPALGAATEMDRLREIGNRGILALLSDCVRVEQPGRTPSERVVAEALEMIIREARGRVILTTFASNITRLEQVTRIASMFGRKVAVIGRSMEDSVKVAQELDYLRPPVGTIVSLREIRGLPQNRVLLLAAGSQGEPTSALARIAAGDHPQIKIVPGDTVIVSATPVPGNEETVAKTIDNLFRRGAVVLYRDVAPNVHVSGHASRDELKDMIGLIKPKFCVPLHGEYRHMVLYQVLAGETGIPPERVILAEIGDVVELTSESARKKGRVPSGSVLVDGLTLGVTQTVLRERGKLAEDGILIAAVAVDRETGRILGGPDILSRGFVYRDEEDLFKRGRAQVLRAVKRQLKGEAEYGFIVGKIKDVLGKFIYEQTRLQPLILPVVTEV